MNETQIKAIEWLWSEKNTEMKFGANIFKHEAAPKLEDRDGLYVLTDLSQKGLLSITFDNLHPYVINHTKTKEWSDYINRLHRPARYKITDFLSDSKWAFFIYGCLFKISYDIVLRPH